MIQEVSTEIQKFGERRSIIQRRRMELTLRELKTIRRFLTKAQALIVHVSFLVFNADDSKTAARLNDITARLTDEIEGIERLIERR